LKAIIDIMRGQVHVFVKLTYNFSYAIYLRDIKKNYRNLGRATHQ